MKLILLGTDFTEETSNAHAQAAELARKTGAQLHILHVLEPVDDPDSDDPETQEFYDKLEAKSQERLAALINTLSGVTANSSIVIGNRHPTILEQAQDLGADMIVLGSKPLEADNKRFGTSHRVAVTSPIPVLLVPN